MPQFQGRKIALVGAAGNIGVETVKALLFKSVHTLAAISCTESDATFPPPVNVVRGSYADEEFLASTLKGQDVLILQLGHPGNEISG